MSGFGLCGKIAICSAGVRRAFHDFMQKPSISFQKDKDMPLRMEVQN